MAYSLSGNVMSAAEWVFISLLVVCFAFGPLGLAVTLYIQETKWLEARKIEWHARRRLTSRIALIVRSIPRLIGIVLYVILRILFFGVRSRSQR